MRWASFSSTVLRVRSGRELRSRSACSPPSLEPLPPLPRRLAADAGGLGRRHQPDNCNAFDEQLASFEGQSGILVAVHLVGFL
jgi:hypothetical protein